MCIVVYYSGKTGNTKRFLERVESLQNLVPLKEDLTINTPYVLFSSSYADRYGNNALPLPVKKFLESEINQKNLKGVGTSGNKNFGENYGIAGDYISKKFNVPLLMKFELFGTKSDEEKYKEVMKSL